MRGIGIRGAGMIPVSMQGGGQGAALTLFRDSFTGADNTLLSAHTPDVDYLGRGWVRRNGLIRIKTNKARMMTGTLNYAAPAPQAVHTFDTGMTNVNLSMTVNMGAMGAGLVVRYNPGDGTFYYIVGYIAGTNALRVFYWTGAAFTQVKSKVCPLAASTDYVLSASVDGNLLSYSMNGVSDTYTMLNNLTCTHFGIQAATHGTVETMENLLCTAIGAVPTTARIETLSPQPYQVFQRDGADQADIAISGVYFNGTPTTIEASWNGGAYVEIDAAPAGGTFSGTLTGLAAGQGTLIVRFSNDTAVNFSTAYVGIGDVFVCAGQSNMSGRGVAVRTYTHATLKAGLYGNDYNWHNLIDYIDRGGNIDTVSIDEQNIMGSWVVLMATSIMATTGLPVAFITCAMGGTAIAAWQPGADHNNRATLYGSMNYRITQAGGARLVLWWQGEQDASLGTTQAVYNAALDALANAINADQGLKLMACKLQDLSGAGWDEAAVNAAIAEAWGDNVNCPTGPDFSDLTPAGDGIHFTSLADQQTCADRWDTAIDTLYGW